MLISRHRSPSQAPISSILYNHAFPLSLHRFVVWVEFILNSFSFCPPTKCTDLIGLNNFCFIYANFPSSNSYQLISASPLIPEPNYFSLSVLPYVALLFLPSYRVRAIKSYRETINIVPAHFSTNPPLVPLFLDTPFLPASCQPFSLFRPICPSKRSTNFPLCFPSLLLYLCYCSHVVCSSLSILMICVFAIISQITVPFPHIYHWSCFL